MISESLGSFGMVEDEPVTLVVGLTGVDAATVVVVAVSVVVVLAGAAVDVGVARVV